MSEQTSKVMKPPYLAFETFKNSLRELGKAGNLPDRIDNSVFPQMSGSGRAQFIQALKFFKLIDENGAPVDVLSTLCKASETEWKECMKVLLPQHYEKQLKTLESGTVATFKDSFGDIGGSIVGPAARFLLQAARDAGLKVSAHIKQIPASNGSKKKKDPEVGGESPTLPPSPALPVTPTTGNAMVDALLSKFPSFDPNWDEQQQKRWFEAFSQLLSMQKKGGEV